MACHLVTRAALIAPSSAHEEISNNPHEANSPLEDPPQTHANRARRHELRDVAPRHPYVDMYRPKRCFLVSLLPCHSIASACILRCPFCRLTPYRRLCGLRNLNNLCCVDPTIASSTSSATFNFVYTGFTKESGKRMVSRLHIFSLSERTKDIIRIVLPLLTIPISQSFVSSRKRNKSCRRKY